MITLKGRKVVGGKASGEALVSKDPISFFGGVAPNSGEVIEKNHELEGVNISGKVVVFPKGKGSTVGSYTLYAMAKNGTAPVAMINVESDPITALGCSLAGIPLVDKLNKNPLRVIKTGDLVEVIADKGLVKIIRKH
jgi:hypothetical protein